MSSFGNRFAELKKKVSGNREKVTYEHTFGMSREELEGISPVNRWNRRILSETEFAIRLSAELNHCYDDAVDAALKVLEEGMEEEGVLTRSVCLKAEEKLLVMAQAAKEYTLILAGHAHIDMNWMWGWQETVAVTLNTFRTMLHIMEEYPDFCFSQSQASVYQIVEQYDPEMMEEIKQRIREGRWEITATSWVETDKNMPCTDSILNHMLYTKKYLQEHWDIDPASLEIDFSPDTFGHSRHLPELDALGGVRYYYHCRGLKEKYIAYRWKSPSGQEMLCHKEPYWYNSGIVPDTGIAVIENAHLCGGLKTGLVVYGVGDHGGGPTRRDVERAIEMNQWPVFPNYRFGTVRQYFQELETVREKLPLVEHEMNFLLTGCYTTQSRLKLGNRHAESALNGSQAWSSAASAVLGTKYPFERFEKAWQNVLFCHFHDILTGSCVQESREHGMGLLAESMAIAQTAHNHACRKLSESIDTSFVVMDTDIASSQSEGAGAGYGIGNYAGVPNPEKGAGKTRIFHVFNPSAHPRKDHIEITVWDYTGDLRYLALSDADGREVPFQLLDTSLIRYWDHRYFRFLAEVEVPALGYTTLVLSEKEREMYTVHMKLEDRTDGETPDFVLENEYLRARFDYMDGSLISLVDKETGEERMGADRGSVVLLNTESATSDAWHIGHYLERIPLKETVRIHALPQGQLRNGFEMEQRVLNSTVKTVVTLESGAKMLDIHLSVDWNEKGQKGQNIPVLAYYLPLKDEICEYRYDVPGGYAARENFRQEVPGLMYGAAVLPDGRAAALICDCKYGYRGADNSLTLTLINSATNPDPDPERGMHEISISVALGSSDPAELENLAFDRNHPFHYLHAGWHKGSLPAKASFLNFVSNSAVLSSVTRDPDGSTLCRIYEMNGKKTAAVLQLPQVSEKQKPISAAVLVDLAGKPMGEASFSDTQVSLELEPYQTRILKIR